MSFDFRCSNCKSVAPLKVWFLDSDGFNLTCSVCETSYWFEPVSVEQCVHPTVATSRGKAWEHSDQETTDKKASRKTATSG